MIGEHHPIAVAKIGSTSGSLHSLVGCVGAAPVGA